MHDSTGADVEEGGWQQSEDGRKYSGQVLNTEQDLVHSRCPIILPSLSFLIYKRTQSSLPMIF